MGISEGGGGWYLSPLVMERGSRGGRGERAVRVREAACWGTELCEGESSGREGGFATQDQLRQTHGTSLSPHVTLLM